MTFAEMVAAIERVEKSRQLLICPVGEKEKLEALILRYDLAGLWEVHESRHCPEDTVYLLKPPPDRI